MPKGKIHPRDYRLTPDEIQDLRDFALKACARLEETSGRTVRLAQNSGTDRTATETWEERKRQREAEGRDPL